MGGSGSKTESFYEEAVANWMEKKELNLSHQVTLEIYLGMMSYHDQKALASFLSSSSSSSSSSSRSSSSHSHHQHHHDHPFVVTPEGKIPLLMGSLPSSLDSLEKLTSFKAAFHALSAFRLPVGWQSHLTVLDLRGNRLSSFPPSLLSHPSLSTLDLSENKIEDGLSSPTNLPMLQKLNLSGNRIQELTSSFLAGLPSLQKLNLNNNLLSKLPLELGLLPLSVLLALVNRLSEPSQELANKGSSTLISHLREKASSSRQSLMKILPRPTLAGSGNEEQKGKEKGKEEGTWEIQPLPKGQADALKSRILGTLLGSGLGDSIGLLSEFMTPEEAAFYYEAPLRYEDCLQDRHRCKWLPGDFTDDTDQMICILQSLLANGGKVDLADFARRLLSWSEKGFPELGDVCGSGIGKNVGMVLSKPNFTENPEQAAREVWEKTKSAANGGVMRTCVLGVLDFGDLSKVIENTEAFCRVTHYDPKCQASCVVVTTFIAMVLQWEKERGEKQDQRHLTQEEVLGLLDRAIQYGRKELERQLSGATEEEREAEVREFNKHAAAKSFGELELGYQKIGYTYKCMGCGIVGVRRAAEGFEKVITDLVLEGGDADTNAVVCGAMLGCVWGLQNLPSRWLDSMKNREWLEKQSLDLLPLLGLPF